MRWPSSVVLAIVAIVALVQAVAGEPRRPRVEDDTMTLRTFLLTYRCAVLERLQLIHENRESETDRFFVLSLKYQAQSYVQCIFLDGDSRMLCEAASGFYLASRVQDRNYWLRPERVAALARLGFSTDDSKGNFQKMIEFDREPDLAAIADLILTTLYEVYDARAGSELKWTSPLADFDPSESTCTPIG